MCFGLAACDARPVSTHHEAYADGLREAGFAELPAGAAWLEAGTAALDDPEPGALPLHVEGWFPDDSPAARAWRVAVTEGQTVFVSARLEGRSAGRLFVEVFRPARDTTAPAFALGSAGEMARVLEVEATRTTELIIRLQPELLRGGRFVLDAAADTPLDLAGIARRRDGRHVSGVRGR